MDGFYRCIETSLLAFGLALGIAVAALSALPPTPTAGPYAVTLSEIAVSPDE